MCSPPILGCSDRRVAGDVILGLMTAQDAHRINTDQTQQMSGVSPYNSLMATSNDRVEFRISGELKEELETAAAMRGLTTSAFVKDAALRAAREAIQEERVLRLGEEDWEMFTAAISRPGEYNEGLAELLRRPSVFSEE